jgi:hypothetical protein
LHSPSGSKGEIGVLHPMPMYSEWDICPHCRKRLSDVRMGILSDTTIGPALATCPRCKGIYKTGKSEWAEKSKIGKMGYYVRVARWCIGTALGVAALCVVATLLIMGLALKASSNQMVLGGVVVAVVVGILTLGFVLRSAQMEIKKSLERSQRVGRGNPEA